MIISESKRDLRLSHDGRLPGADTGTHLGPGRYKQSYNTISARKKKASFAGFGSTQKRESVVVKEGPGPGKFQRNQFAFDKIIGKEDDLSSMFKTRQPRFADNKSASATIGPGYYKPACSDFDRSVGRKKNRNNLLKPSKNSIQIERGPSVPSVPNRMQKHGYKEDSQGKLRLQKSPKAPYTGGKFGNHNDVNNRATWIQKHIQDTVGPAYYDRPDSTSFGAAVLKRSRPGKTGGSNVAFAKSRDQRRLWESHTGASNLLPDSRNPGPGYYNSHMKARQRRKPQLSSSFASRVPQNHDVLQNYRATLPGPNDYTPIEAKYRNQVPYTGVAAFGSHTRRNLHNNDNDSAPGPGSYNTLQSSFDNSHSNGYSLRNMSDQETAFGSTSERPCLTATKATKTGPGTYGDSRTFSALTQKINKKASVGKRGVFSTTAKRFVPGEHLDGSKIVQTPGVGRYQIKAPRFQRKRESSVFQSTSTRRARPTMGNPEYTIVGSETTPAPGQYEPDSALSIGGATPALANKESKKRKPFNATSKRFSQDRIFGAMIDPSGPAPGSYKTNRGNLAHKLKLKSVENAGNHTNSRSGVGFGGSTTRFKKLTPALDTDGPGINLNSMVKKSFNRKAGYKPTKPSNRRVEGAQDPSETLSFTVEGLTKN